MRCEPRHRPSGQQGFVLAMTLWILVAITLVAAAVSLWALDEVREAQTARDQVADRADMVGTRDTLFYLLATRDATLAGLPIRALTDAEVAVRRLEEMGGVRKDPLGGELRMDGSPYQGLGQSQFALQDEAGLFPLIEASPEWFDRFLNSRGVPGSQSSRLRDALFDWQDDDDLNRLNGAEAGDYRKAKRPPPPNRRLLAPLELRHVMGWDALPEPMLRSLIDTTTAFHGTGVNLNTAPPSLLAAWLPGCPATCENFDAIRRNRPFRSGPEVERMLGLRLPGDSVLDYRFAPGDIQRITVWGRTGMAWRYHVALTPLADRQGPWLMLAAYPAESPVYDEPAESTGSPLFADAPRGRR